MQMLMHSLLFLLCNAYYICTTVRVLFVDFPKFPLGSESENYPENLIVHPNFPHRKTFSTSYDIFVLSWDFNALKIALKKK